ncbi:MAG: TIM-barrel domain-containing protein [Agriterribacter sp.]
MMRFSFLRLISLFFLSVVFNTVLQAQSKTMEWVPVAPGVWKAVTGTPENIDPLRIAGIKPDVKALEKLGDIAFPERLNQSTGEQSDAKTFLSFPLGKNEQLFGFGLNFKSVQQRGMVKELQVDHYGGEDNGRTHAPVPFYISGNGYGILVNVARRVKVYAGIIARKDSKNPPPEMNRNTQPDWNPEPGSDVVEMSLPAAGAEIYVFAGRNPMEVVQRYNLFCGGGVLPPKWGLGFTQRTPTLFTDKQVMEEANAFEQKGYPLSFIGLEPGWQGYAYPNSFVWDSARFPQPAEFVKQLLNKNIRVNLWINPYISSHAPFYKNMQPYTGSHLVWAGQVPDLTMKPVQDLYQQLFSKQHLDIGISGYKVDETDGYDFWLWPDVAKFPSGVSGEQMRQVYGLQFQKMSDNWFRQKNQRTYGLTRASNAGASSLPYVIYNDYYNHRDFITALCNSSFIGVLWTPEARSSKTAEEWLRRMQTVCFSPMAMLNAWADGTKPWSFPEVANEVKDVMMLRMQLLPYLYNAFAQYRFEGKPPVRAMNLVEGFYFNATAERGNLSSSDNPYEMAVRRDINDQFMVGDYLLVAPLFAGQKERKVVLPPGKWYNFYTGQLAGEGTIIEVKQEMGKIPLFVKDGGIIPMIPAVLHTPAKNELLPLQVKYYGKAENAAELYDDDGETFDYEKGAFAKAKLSVKKDKKGRLKGSVELPVNKNFHYNKITWQFMTP